MLSVKIFQKNLYQKFCIAAMTIGLVNCGGETIDENSLQTNNGQQAETTENTQGTHSSTENPLPSTPSIATPAVATPTITVPTEPKPSTQTPTEPPSNPVVNTPAIIDLNACRSYDTVKSLFAEHNCLKCHSSTLNSGDINLEADGVGKRLIGKVSAFGGDACLDEKVIHPTDPDNSLFLKLIDGDLLRDLNRSACQRGPMPPAKTTMNKDEVACVKTWLREVAKTEVAPTPVTPDNEFEPTNASMALSKAKYILHGGGPTSKELDTLGGSLASVDSNALKDIIKTWEKTEPYRQKIENFLMLSLQQQTDGGIVSTYTPQFGKITVSDPVDRKRINENFNAMFMRRAWEIFNNGEDFRNVVTTRKWHVTTATLAALVFAEKTGQPEKFAKNNFIKDADYTDWRTIEITPSNTPQNYANSEAFINRLRNLKDGDAFPMRFPRVGFFSSPVFLDNWDTNPDNQFRVTTQQTLITALSRVFDPSDQTAHLSENGLPKDHAAPGSDCYQCHRLMDPMRLIFSKYQNTNYRAKVPNDTVPGFAFASKNKKQVKSVDEFANLLKTHPHFAKAWVQKLCIWGNSQTCDERDETFKHLTSVFKNNQFNLKILVRNFFSSPLFTGSEQTKTYETKPFLVSLSRGNHFCHAIKTRTNTLKLENGTKGNINKICNGIGRQSFGIISPDTFVRGEKHLVQSVQTVAFDSKSIDRQCAQVAGSIFANNTNKLFNTNVSVDDIFSQLTRVFVGIPENHHRYNQVVTGLKRIYQIANHPTSCGGMNVNNQGEAIQCGLGLNKPESLKMAWFSACTSPDLIAVGL